MKYISVAILVIFVSTTKFAAAPFLSLAKGFGYFEAVIFSVVGGISGIFIYAFFSRGIYLIWKKIKSKFVNDKSVPSKKFSSRRRLFVKIKMKFGLLGIAALTPVLISIPVGMFFGTRYYPVKKVFIYMISSVIFWALLLNAIVIIRM